MREIVSEAPQSLAKLLLSLAIKEYSSNLEGLLLLAHATYIEKWHLKAVRFVCYIKKQDIRRLAPELDMLLGCDEEALDVP